MDINNERIAITKFLQWNDRNGWYTDENCDLEELPRMTYEDAKRYFFCVINEEFYYEITSDIFELPYDKVMGYAKENQFYNRTIEKLNKLISSSDHTTELYKSII